MKKLILLLALAAIAVTSTFATTTTSFDGSRANAPEMNVTLKSTLLPTNYNLSLVYGSGADASDFTDSGEKTITGLDLTNIGYTKDFNVIISKGNLNKSITFVTVITENPFIGQVDGKEYITNNDLKVVSYNSDFQTTYTSLVKAGPHEKQNIARFYFDWIGDKSLPAGDYVSTNTINISVN
jgi:hypothetical protein